MRLKTGDKVMVVSGKDAGKQARIEKVLPAENKVLVEGVNTAKRHSRPSGSTMQGGIIDRDMPIDASNVMIVCPDCGPTRIGIRADEKGKHRICRKCGGDL